MREWRRYVRDRLPVSDIKAQRALDLVDELASQLEDVYRTELSHGASEREADAKARAHIEDWDRLAAEIRLAAPSLRRPSASRWADRADERARSAGRWGAWLADLGMDVRYSLRALRRKPTFAVVVVLLVGLGVGVNTAVFSALKAIYLEPLPFPEPQAVAVLWETTTRGGRGPVSWPNYRDWKAQNRSFEHMGLMSEVGVTLSDSGAAEAVLGAWVTSSVFDVFGVRPALGRTITPDEDSTSARVAVLSHELWATRYGADPLVVGRQIRINGDSYDVVGVMPERFVVSSVWRASSRIRLWVPFPAGAREPQRDSRSHPVVARLRDGVTLEGAAADMERVARNLAAAYPETNRTQRVRVQSLHAALFGDLGTLVSLVFAAAGLVLLIACGNVAGLLVVRFSGRRAEIAVRSALGAGRGRVMRMLLAESGLLALVGGAVAVLLALGGLGALRGLLPAWVPRAADIRADGSVLLFAVAISFLTAIVFGLAPALGATRGSQTEALKEAGGERAGLRAGGARQVFAVAQIALTLVLAHLACLQAGSYLLLRGMDLGFDAENTLTAAVTLRGSAYRDADRRQAFFHELLARLEALPGVTHAGAVSGLPFEGGNNGRFVVEGRAIPSDPNDLPLVERKSVVGDYLRAMGIRLLAGRMLTAADTFRNASGAGGAIINERMAQQLWPGEVALGKRFRPNSPESVTEVGAAPEWLTVVGVVADVRQWGMEQPAIAESYRPYMIAPQQRMFVALRTAVEPTSIVAAVRREVGEMDRGVAVSAVRTMQEVVASELSWRKLLTSLVGLFAALALILAVAGVYGSLSYFVAQRAHELGVRMALGARRGQVLLLVMGRGAKLALWGVALGTGGALAASQVTRGFLYGLRPADPWFIGGVATLLLVTAVSAALVPARRATKVDPALALRAE